MLVWLVEFFVFNFSNGYMRQWIGEKAVECVRFQGRKGVAKGVDRAVSFLRLIGEFVQPIPCFAI